MNSHMHGSVPYWNQSSSVRWVWNVTAYQASVTFGGTTRASNIIKHLRASRRTSKITWKNPTQVNRSIRNKFMFFGTTHFSDGLYMYIYIYLSCPKQKHREKRVKTHHKPRLHLHVVEFGTSVWASNWVFPGPTFYGLGLGPKTERNLHTVIEFVWKKKNIYKSAEKTKFDGLNLGIRTIDDGLNLSKEWVNLI